MVSMWRMDVVLSNWVSVVYPSRDAVDLWPRDVIYMIKYRDNQRATCTHSAMIGIHILWTLQLGNISRNTLFERNLRLRLEEVVVLGIHRLLKISGLLAWKDGGPRVAAGIHLAALEHHQECVQTVEKLLGWTIEVLYT